MMRNPGFGSTTQHRTRPCLILLLLAACTQPPATSTSAAWCRSTVQPILADLARAGDPATYAARHHLDYRDGRVAVRIAVQADPDGLARRYDLEAQLITDHYYGPLLAARVPLGRLCELSHDPRTGHIAAPTARLLPARFPSPTPTLTER